MKAELPKALLAVFIAMARDGEGREREAGGGNTVTDITLMRSDLEGYPELVGLAGGAIRITLNQHGGYVGHRVIVGRGKAK